MEKQLTAIVAIDRRGAIGCKNALPWKLKTDMKFFKDTTIGHTVIMGRKTHDSIGGCLPKRNNIVLSHNSFQFDSAPNCNFVCSKDEALAKAWSDSKDEVFIVGGAMTYLLFSDYVSEYLITEIAHTAVKADAYLDQSIRNELKDWDKHHEKSFPAQEGVDDYPCRITRYLAPDSEKRTSAWKTVAEQVMVRSQVKKSSSSRRSANRGAPAHLQEALFAT